MTILRDQASAVFRDFKVALKYGLNDKERKSPCAVKVVLHKFSEDLKTPEQKLLYLLQDRKRTYADLSLSTGFKMSVVDTTIQNLLDSYKIKCQKPSSLITDNPAFYVYSLL